MAYTPAMDPSEVSTNGTELVGEIFEGADGKKYRVVKAAANISAAAKKLVVWTSEANGTVNVTTTANDATVVGIIPSDINTISSTSGQLDSGDVFCVQVAGLATALNAGAIAANATVGSSTTGGSIDDASITEKGMIGYAVGAASTTAGQDVTVFLRGLV